MEWTKENINELTVIFEAISDNTSEFTRTKAWGKDKRNFDVKMKFSANGVVSDVLAINEVISPYVPPHPQSRGESKYGKEFIYGYIPSIVIDHIISSASAKGYTVLRGDPGLVNNEDDLWYTVSIPKGSVIKMADPPNCNLSFIFARTKMGVIFNMGAVLKLKCSLDEAIDPDTGSLFTWQHSDVYPDDGTVWSINVAASWGYITEVGADADVPQKTDKKGTKSSVAHVPPPATQADRMTDDALAKLKALKIV